MPEADKKKLCFVVSPIGAAGSEQRIHADWLYDGIIKPVFKEHFTQFEVERADKISTPGMIDAQVINRLLDAELVVADMSFQNANAFYEMGIRHVKGLATIHMFLEDHPIPFDVKPHRAIPFRRTNYSDLEEAKVALKAAVDETLKPGFVVTRARGIEKLDERATAPQQLLLQEVRGLSERIGRLENRRVPLRDSIVELVAERMRQYPPGGLLTDHKGRSFDAHLQRNESLLATLRREPGDN